MHLILGGGTAYQPELFWSTKTFLELFFVYSIWRRQLFYGVDLFFPCTS